MRRIRALSSQQPYYSDSSGGCAEQRGNHLTMELYERFEKAIGRELLQHIEVAADRLGQEVRVVGGTVRDLLLYRHSTDFDFVTQGSGIELAKALKAEIGRKAHLSLFKAFGTAQVKVGELELEFVGARKESYRSDSRKPIVEDGTFAEDEERRDFTMNTLSITLNGEAKGRLNDPFGGEADIKWGVIRTPLEPEVTFSDDPLRMMRAVRFASQLHFSIDPTNLQAIKRQSQRLLPVVSMERITTEFMKIIESPQPSIGLRLMEECGLMQQYLPEVSALKGAETKEGIGHKNNFDHTLQVVDNAARVSSDPFLRLAALFHDIGKPRTKQFTPRVGWSFHNHDFVGSKMLPKIFRRVKLPLDERMHYVQKLVRLHMRPAQLADEGVTDSAIRRLLFEAGDDIDDLMTLCESDLTSKNPKKVQKYLDNFRVVRGKLVEIEEKDRIRNFQPPIMGDEIMYIFGITPCRAVGELKEAIKDAILDGVIANERTVALAYMYRHAAEHFPELKVVHQVEE